MSDQLFAEAATYTTIQKQTPVLYARLETAIPAIKWLQTQALHREATETGLIKKNTGSIFYDSFRQVREIGIYSRRRVAHKKKRLYFRFNRTQQLPKKSRTIFWWLCKGCSVTSHGLWPGRWHGHGPCYIYLRGNLKSDVNRKSLWTKGQVT